MMPRIKTDFLSNSIEKQNRIENQFIELKENFECQREIIDKLLAEINSLKEDQIKKSTEIIELKNTIKNQSIQISEIEKNRKNELSLIKENHLNDINELNRKIKNQSNEINELKNTINIQSFRISEIDKKHKNDLSLIQISQMKNSDEIENQANEIKIQNDRIVELEKKHENDFNSIKQNKSNDDINKQNLTQFIYDFNKSNRFDGIINYLTKKYGGNVHKKGIVNLTASSILRDEYNPCNSVDLLEDSCFESGSKPNSWLCFDFKIRQVKMNAYSIRTYGGMCHLQSWHVDGSNDNTKWILLDSKVREKSLDGCKYSNTFIVDQENKMNIIDIFEFNKQKKLLEEMIA